MNVRRWLLILLIIETPIQAVWNYQWVAKHGFFGGIIYYFTCMTIDPILAVAIVDFAVVQALVGLWLLHDDQGRKRGAGFWTWCFLYVMLPSAAIPIYFLWIRGNGLRLDRSTLAVKH